MQRPAAREAAGAGDWRFVNGGPTVPPAMPRVHGRPRASRERSPLNDGGHMKRATFLALTLIAAAVVTLPLASHAKDAMKGKGAMAQYLVIAPHSPEQCAKT